jgi:ATP synthase protein I
MTDEGNGLLRSVRQRRERHARWQREGEPSFARQVAQIGILGWTIVLPTLIGVFLGRWLDRWLGSGIFWTAPLMLIGLGLGCWSAWRWVRGR